MPEAASGAAATCPAAPAAADPEQALALLRLYCARRTSEHPSHSRRLPGDSPPIELVRGGVGAA